jgi:nucleoside-diphosphate-sugar epimerase
MQKILVTGSNGFIGRALCRELLARGFGVRGAQRTFDNFEGLELVNGSMDPSFEWAQALSGMDCIVHCAARTHILVQIKQRPLDLFRLINTESTLNLAEQAAKNGIKRFIYISSIGVNGPRTFLNPFSEKDTPNPQNEYAQSKYEAEMGLLSIATRSRMEVVVIRPPLVYGIGAPGNFEVLKTWIEKGLPLPLGLADRNLRNFIALPNLLDFIIHCINHPRAANEIFLVSDDESISTVEFVRYLAKIALKKPFLIPIPPSFIGFLAALFDFSQKYHGLFSNLQIDNSKSKCLLNWSPPFSLEKAFAHLVDDRGAFYE